MSKAGAEVILRSLLNWPIDVDALPFGEEERVPAGIETVIVADTVRPANGRRVEIVEIKREDGGTREVVVGTLDGEDYIDDYGEDIIIKDEPLDDF